MAADEKQNLWVERVLGVAVSDGEADPFKDMYEGLLSTAPGDLARLRSFNPQAAEPIAALVASAAALAETGDFRQAFAAIDEAATKLAEAASSSRSGEAASVIPEGKVADMVSLLEEARSKWSAAIDGAKSSSRSFQTEMDEAFPAEADGFIRVLDSYWEELDETLAEAHGAGDQSGLAAVLQKSQTLRAEMMADELFSYLDSNGVEARPAFIAALDEVDSLLA